MTTSTMAITPATHPAHYINGQQVKASSAETLLVCDFSTEALMATVPAGTALEAEAEAAVLRGRAAYLYKVAAGIKVRTEELTIAREVGMPLKMARAVQVGGPVWCRGDCRWRRSARGGTR